MATNMKKMKNPEWFLKSRATKPEEWLKLIMSQPEEIRPKLACVVWWDFFAGRLTEKRWNHLDSVMSEYSNDCDYPPEELMKALIAIGYPQNEAKKRSMNPKKSY